MTASAVRLDWRSPLCEPLFTSDNAFHEYKDGKVFDAIDHPALRPRWSEYWPQRSQTWDAIAVAYGATDAPLGPVLIEAKSHPNEFWPKSGGSKAGEDSIGRIHDRLRQTRKWLGVEESPDVVEQWEGRLYQSANRFATLRFFQEFVDPPVPAWLLNLYFLNDTTHTNPKLATSRAQWDEKLPKAEEVLGLGDKEVPHSGRAFLEAGTYEELVAVTGG